MKYLRVNMPDGSKWDVPVSVIAQNRAAEYAHEFDGDVQKSLDEAGVSSNSCVVQLPRGKSLCTTALKWKFDGVILTRGQFVVINGRTIIADPDDMGAEHAIQDGMQMRALSEFLRTEMEKYFFGEGSAPPSGFSEEKV